MINTQLRENTLNNFVPYFYAASKCKTNMTGRKKKMGDVGPISPAAKIQDSTTENKKKGQDNTTENKKKRERKYQLNSNIAVIAKNRGEANKVQSNLTQFGGNFYLI